VSLGDFGGEGTGEFGLCFDKDFVANSTTVFLHVTLVGILRMVHNLTSMDMHARSQ